MHKQAKGLTALVRKLLKTVPDLDLPALCASLMDGGEDVLQDPEANARLFAHEMTDMVSFVMIHATATAIDAAQVYLTESVFKVALQKSTPPHIRQLILCARVPTAGCGRRPPPFSRTCPKGVTCVQSDYCEAIIVKHRTGNSILATP